MVVTKSVREYLSASDEGVQDDRIFANTDFESVRGPAAKGLYAIIGDA